MDDDVGADDVDAAATSADGESSSSSLSSSSSQISTDFGFFLAGSVNDEELWRFYKYMEKENVENFARQNAKF